MSTPDDVRREIERLAAGAQGPPQIESEILVRAARAVRDAIARGDDAPHIVWAVLGTLTDERLGYQRMVRLEDIARAAGIEVPTGPIAEAVERERTEARRRVDEQLLEDIAQFPGGGLTDPWQDAADRGAELIDRDVLDSDEAWERGDEPESQAE